MMMHSRRLLWGIVLWPALWLAAAGAQAAQDASPPKIKASSWLLVDHHSGKVLAEHRADARQPPASLTKLMTAYVLFQKLRGGDLTVRDPVIIGTNAWEAGGTRMFLQPNTVVNVDDLIRGMLVQSANDAAVALAEYASGTQEKFIDLMNRQSRALGLSNTHFTNITGISDPDHYTSARDMSRLAGALMRDYPEYYKWFSLKEFSYRRIEHHNRNALLWRDPSVDGLKSGYNRSAGYCLAASARRDRMRLIVIIMGAPSDAARVQGAQKLLDFGFRNFETRLLYQADAVTVKVPVWMGDTDMLPLGLNENLYVTIPRGSFDKLAADIKVDEVQYAPVQRGQKIGTLSVTYDEQLVRQYPLVALREVGFGNIFQRTIDRIRLWFQ